MTAKKHIPIEDNFLTPYSSSTSCSLPVLWQDMQLSQCFSPPRFFKWIASITVRVSQQNDKGGGGEVGISGIELASIPSEGMNTFP